MLVSPIILITFTNFQLYSKQVIFSCQEGFTRINLNLKAFKAIFIHTAKYSGVKKRNTSLDVTYRFFQLANSYPSEHFSYKM